MTSLRTRWATTLCAALLVAMSLFAGAVPAGGGTSVPNDDFQRATVVRSLPASFSQSTVQASVQAGEPRSQCSNPFKTVWFELRVERSARLVVDMAGSEFDNVVAVFSGRSMKDLSDVACTDGEWTAFDATAGNTYYIQVSGWVWTSGQMQMNVFETTATGPPPANDDREDAVDISALPFSEMVDARTATWDHLEEFVACADGYPPVVWYRLETALPRTVTLDTFGSDYDTAISVTPTVVGGGSTEMQHGDYCNDDAGGTQQSQLTFDALPGVIYFVQVAGTDRPQGNLHFNAR